MKAEMDREELLAWLRADDPIRLEALWRHADHVRQRCVGDAVHLRGLIEISNYCRRQCAYCGLRAGNRTLKRYRLCAEEIMAAAREVAAIGYGTVVLQGGEDPAIETGWIARLVRQIKAETPLAVTLSLGERDTAELAAWRAAGADRYLLRFETSDPALYQSIHPGLNGIPVHRIDLLAQIRALGYEVGSGIMVGLPGQTYASVAWDLLLFRELDLDMIGIGPFIAHPMTPLGARSGEQAVTGNEQVPNTVQMASTVVALARILCPQANIPSTTAMATLNPRQGCQLALERGANVVMPNFTPWIYRQLYEIYPSKGIPDSSADSICGRLENQLTGMGRRIGRGPGGRIGRWIGSKPEFEIYENVGYA
ncbi:MAG TPA: [FeFe] hydrogenase H-cluster radical SAM maturase HydE [Candidatus Paceibacterota bacterium]|nr:[FeFe] hydrogenase H-cluster radical SAM maturase HydE [Verrucomicrobiota bacterium]HRY49319.1 [FeFe] hydrogenase H-cluster radical SAM maturase HydE [Candidatus Paceibacterota bacterium]HRZ99396.1 [FeFe] hydrogenase H-cluster radical SAM maturase HydE [Candidatus Paceibacterota bacterium]